MVGRRCTSASSLAVSARFPTTCADLTSRFLQFGALENQCAEGYLAVPIASVAAEARLPLYLSATIAIRAEEKADAWKTDETPEIPHKCGTLGNE
ncbi:hypothetical protein KM043_002742 [Ampulex compressa]|nr:hypothetical protein KM043_002742 [Ampulex compressa]